MIDPWSFKKLKMHWNFDLWKNIIQDREGHWGRTTHTVHDWDRASADEARSNQCCAWQGGVLSCWCAGALPHAA
jgi:hypothetical protein